MQNRKEFPILVVNFLLELVCIYTVRPISFETVLQKPPKKIAKNYKQIFLFKVPR